MIDGELFVPMKASEYGVQAASGGPIYTTKDGLATEDHAQEFGAALETVVGKEYRVVSVLVVRVEAKRGRKAGSKSANGQAVAKSSAPSTPSTLPPAPKAPAAAKS